MTNHKDVGTFLSQWTNAELKGDKAALSGLLTDDFRGVGPLGFVLPKQAWLDRFGGGLSYEKFELDETQVNEYGDAAVITTRLHQPGTVNGHPIPAEARATLMLVGRPEGTLLAGISLTFIAGTPGAPQMPGKS